MSKPPGIRQCIGCRRTDSQTQMVRLANRDGVLVISRTQPGRGAWIHQDPTCIGRALSRRMVARTLKAAVDDEALTTLRSQFGNA